MDECHDEQQQLQNRSDASQRYKLVAGEQAQCEAGSYAYTTQQQEKIQILQADDAIQQQTDTDCEAYSQYDGILEKMQTNQCCYDR